MIILLPTRGTEFAPFIKQSHAGTASACAAFESPRAVEAMSGLLQRALATMASPAERKAMATESRAPPTLIAGNAHPSLAARLASELYLSLAPVEIWAFADGETRVHVVADVRESAVFIVQPTCPPVNEHLMVLALLADAVRAAGAARVTAIVPYFGYGRQEVRGRAGDPRSAQVVGRLLASAGVDHLITVDLHAPALESAMPMPATLLRSEEIFIPRIKAWRRDDLIVVAPDAGGMKRAQRLALALETRLVVIAKDRPRADVATPLQVLGDVRDRACLIVDDMASTGRTLCGAAEALRKAGARELHALFTHAVMAPGASDRLAAAGFRSVVTSDSIPIAEQPWLEVATIAPLLARTVRYLCGERIELDQR